MNIKKLINYLKKGGFKIVIFYFIFILIYSLFNVLKFNDVTTMNSGNNSAGRILLGGILSIIFVTVAFAGATGSFDELLSGKDITFESFMKCGKKYFWRTIGFSLVFFLIVAVAALIPAIILAFLAKILIGSISKILVVVFIEAVALEVFVLPYTIFTVLDKYTKGYIKKNYKLLVLYSITSILIAYVPIVGKYINIILNSIYFLLILMLHDDYSNDDSAQILVKEES